MYFIVHFNDILNFHHNKYFSNFLLIKSISPFVTNEKKAYEDSIIFVCIYIMTLLYIRRTLFPCINYNCLIMFSVSPFPLP